MPEKETLKRVLGARIAAPTRHVVDMHRAFESPFRSRPLRQSVHKRWRK